ncbi:PCI domain-containing protein [Candidatus Bathyarchaeota archaeon]|nr:PCI domain-containing protein [Candidatus Bathyarchaeota archaeon]
MIKRRTIGIKIIAALLIILGLFDLVYGTVTSTFILIPLTFTYVAIGWIIAIIAIITGAGLWQLRKWAYWMGMVFGAIIILLSSLNVLFAISGVWEQFILDMYGVTLSDIGYTQSALVTESIITSLPFLVLSSLFLVAIWKMKPTLYTDPAEMFLKYLKLYNRISISDMAQRAGITQVDVELLAQDLAARGEPIEIDLRARELIYKAAPPPPPS